MRERGGATGVGELSWEIVERDGMTSIFQQKVRQVADRARQLVRLYGVSWFVAVVCLVALAVGCLDYLVRFEDFGIRLILFRYFAWRPRGASRGLWWQRGVIVAAICRRHDASSNTIRTWVIACPVPWLLRKDRLTTRRQVRWSCGVP